MLKPSEAEGGGGYQVGGEPQYPGEAHGKLCWGDRLCLAETLMEQALVTWKVCLPAVRFLLGPARQREPAFLNSILQANHITVNCWVPFVFLIGKQASTKYTPLHYPLRGS